MHSGDPSNLLRGPLAVLGHPVGHSLSPLIHNAAFEALGLEPRYVACDVLPENLPKAVAGLRALGFAGANVTVPHKERVLPLMDRLTDRARVVGAVNTIVVLRGESGVRLEGDNTDVDGFLAPLAGVDLKGADIVVLGAGGAARAVVFGLLTAHRPARITLATRRIEQAETLITDLAGYGSGTGLFAIPLPADGSALRAASLIVNTTPIGMHPRADETVCPDSSVFGPSQIVYDLVYRPAQTRLLREAAARGAITIGGLPMLVGQAASAFERWTGRPMPMDVVQKVLRSRFEQL